MGIFLALVAFDSLFTCTKHLRNFILCTESRNVSIFLVLMD